LVKFKTTFRGAQIIATVVVGATLVIAYQTARPSPTVVQAAPLVTAPPEASSVSVVQCLLRSETD